MRIVPGGKGDFMQRLRYFWTGLPLASKLQFIALGLILGSVFVNRDLALRWFGLPLWQITTPLILVTIVLGRLLLPWMLRHPQQAQSILSWSGMIVFSLGLVGTMQWWGRLLITHVFLTTAMWLNASCWFWLISEIQRRNALLAEAEFPESTSTTDDDSRWIDSKETGR